MVERLTPSKRTVRKIPINCVELPHCSHEKVGSNDAAVAAFANSLADVEGGVPGDKSDPDVLNIF
jgi:hypothetical protein